MPLFCWVVWMFWHGITGYDLNWIERLMLKVQTLGSSFILLLAFITGRRILLIVIHRLFSAVMQRYCCSKLLANFTHFDVDPDKIPLEMAETTSICRSSYSLFHGGGRHGPYCICSERSHMLCRLCGSKSNLFLLMSCVTLAGPWAVSLQYCW